MIYTGHFLWRSGKGAIFATRTEGYLIKKRDEIELRVGDRLLVEVSDDALAQLQKMDNITILQEHQDVHASTRFKRNLSLGILLLVIGLSAFSIFPILKSALVGVFLMIFFKCIDLGKVYSQVNWQIIFLLAGMIPLGVAMNNTGADTWLAEQLLEFFGDKSNYIVIGFYSWLRCSSVGSFPTMLQPLLLLLSQSRSLCR